jgi:hypothetical protein
MLKMTMQGFVIGVCFPPTAISAKIALATLCVEGVLSSNNASFLCFQICQQRSIGSFNWFFEARIQI